VSPQGVGNFIPREVGYPLGIATLVVALVWFYWWKHNNSAQHDVMK
jgi:hypothetical protein